MKFRLFTLLALLCAGIFFVGCGPNEPGDDPGDDPPRPVEPSVDPADDPADDPTDDPTDDPVDDPSDDPADDPTDDPSDDPVDDPTDDPTDDPFGDDPSVVPPESIDESTSTEDLLKAMAVDPNNDQAMDIIVGRGEDAVDDLIAALGSESADVRARAAFALEQLGAKAAKALPALKKAAAEDENEIVRDAAAFARDAISTEQ